MKTELAKLATISDKEFLTEAQRLENYALRTLLKAVMRKPKLTKDKRLRKVCKSYGIDV